MNALQYISSAESSYKTKGVCCLITFCLLCFVPTANAVSELIIDTQQEEETDTTWDPRSKQVKRLEVDRGFGGFGKTLVFYADAKAGIVLRIVIDNKSKKFPVAATLFTFEKNVSEESFKKWLNNQHSDALFIDAAKPKSTTKIPAEACQVKSTKLIDHSKEPFGEYDNYKVGFQYVNMANVGKIKIKPFKDEAKVHLKTN